MGCQQRGAHANAVGGAEGTGGAQHFQFVRQGKAVAGFDFDRGDAVGEQALQTRAGDCDQLCLGGGAGGGHGGQNAPAGFGGVLVADAAQARLELGAAVAGEHQVGVAVDQAGGEPAAIDIVVDRRGADQCGRQVGAAADPDDAAIARGHGAVFDGAVAAQLRHHGGDAAALPDRISLHWGPLYRAMRAA